MFQETMRDETAAASTSTDAGGRPFTAEMFIETIDKMELVFDDDGTWEMPTIILHPSRELMFKKEMGRLDSDPVMRARMKELVDEKREAWRVRETGRTLVD